MIIFEGISIFGINLAKRAGTGSLRTMKSCVNMKSCVTMNRFGRNTKKLRKYSVEILNLYSASKL